jgi:RND family efflux transporter MFP subunit
MKRRNKWLFASLTLLLLTLALLGVLEDSVDIEQTEAAPYLPPVSVVTRQPGSYPSVIHVRGEIKPRWSTTLQAMVSGECVNVTDRALAGQKVSQGDLLVAIEDSAYRMAVDEARQVLMEAELNLVQEQKKRVQAQRDWQRTGMEKKPSELALNIPQLALAEQMVTAAKSRLAAAQKNLANTQIRAPFAGLVTQRHVSLGQAVSEGESLLHLIYQNQREMVVTLDKTQWALLENGWEGQTATILDGEGAEIGQAKMVRGGGFLSAETRLFNLFLEIQGETGSTIPVGDFVQVQLPGRLIHNALSVPTSALTRDGFIWYVDVNERLRKFKAKVLFHRGDTTVVQTPNQVLAGGQVISAWRIATTPLASFLAGNRVKPIATESGS